MDALVLMVLVGASARAPAALGTRAFCDRNKLPLEQGEWSREYAHLDVATIENPPVSVLEGQIYVYENFFPNSTIKYMHVDNLAIKTCGASAYIKAGGIDTSGVMVVLHSEPHQEIRTVIDIWGTRAPPAPRPPRAPPLVSPEDREQMKKLRSKYLGTSRVNHNKYNDSDFEV
ncbi:transcription activator MBF2 domain-containing protein [Phthorimaea operculella]|nr:transcription activator MBF2 domain-containing protein [Phthorimaea operculella]